MLSVEATYEIAETCLCLHVQTAGRVVARHVDHVFRPLGLTNGQFATLLTLHQAAPVSIGDLAERLTMEPSTATANLKPLERRGLVVSRSHAIDGRVRIVTLTDTGRAVLADAIELWVAADGRASRGLSGSQVRALRLALRRLSTTRPPVRVSSAKSVDINSYRERCVSHRSGNKPMTDQKVVLITGASSGIGRATAELLTSRGYRVFGTARNLDTVVPVQGVELLSLDVRDDASVARGVETALSRAGRIDVLVNNAGYSVVGAIEATSPSEAQALFDTNVFGVLRMVRAVLPAMRRQGSGTIVNTSSVLAFLPGPFMGLYASSKHALEGLSESLDHEVRAFGIRVVLVEPNFTKTQIGANAIHARQTIAAYAGTSRQVSDAIATKIQGAFGPETVAAEILRAIERPHRMRRPVGFEARLLSRLRRFMRAGPVDRSLRKAFALI